jgi:hypothetical protein
LQKLGERLFGAAQAMVFGASAVVVATPVEDGATVGFHSV